MLGAANAVWMNRAFSGLLAALWPLSLVGWLTIAQEAAPQVRKLQEVTPNPRYQVAIGPKYDWLVGFQLNGEVQDFHPDDSGPARQAERAARSRRDPYAVAVWSELAARKALFESTNSFGQAAQTAERLLREDLSRDPTNGWLRARLALTLPEDRHAEAEAQLRQALTNAPQDARVWNRLAFVLQQDCQAKIGFTQEALELAQLSGASPDAAMKRIQSTVNALERHKRDRIRERFQEASRCVERSAALPNAEVDFWFDWFVFEAALAPRIRTLLSDPGLDSEESARKAVRGLREVMRSSTDNPVALTSATFFIVFKPLANLPAVDFPESLALLSPEDRQALEASLTRLRQLCVTKDPVRQRMALQSLATLLVVFKSSPSEAVELATQGARLSPNSAAGWELAVAAAETAQFADKALALADEALKHVSTPTLRLARARILASMGRWGEAVPDIEAAATLASNNPQVRFAVASLHLRTGGQAEWKVAGTILGELNATPTDRDDLEPDLSIARAIQLGLTGQAMAGRRLLLSLLAAMPEETSQIGKVMEALRDP